MDKRNNKSSMSREVNCLKSLKMFFVLFLLILVHGLSAVNNRNAGKASYVVTGIVRDAHTKKAISAAQISVYGKKGSTVSNDNGYFKLDVTSKNDVLDVTAYDYNPMQISVRGRDSIVIDLYSDFFNAYYKKVEGLTGAIDNLSLFSPVKSVDDFSNSTAISTDEAIASSFGGEVRSISRSGVAGEGAALFVRGINSLNANAQPLIVVDGVVWNNHYDDQSIHNGFYSNPLDFIDINDVESVSLVKDGGSIYGSKAANGVILIKTKRAKSMVTRINLSVSSGFNDRPSTIPMMGGEDFRVYASNMAGTAGYTGAQVSSLGFLQTSTLTNAEKKIYNTYHNNTDWADEVYQTGLNNRYSINATGGDEKALYYFSLGYADVTGSVKTTDFQRYNTRFNADIKMLSNVQLGLNIGFTRTERTLLDDGITYTSPTWLSQIKSPFLSPNTFTTTGLKNKDYADYDIFGIGNPSYVIASSINSQKKFRLNIGVTPTWKITPAVTISSQFDYNFYKNVEGAFDPVDATAPQYIYNMGYTTDRVMSQVMRNTSIFNDTRVAFEKNVNNHHFKAMYGWRYINNYYESDLAEEYNTGSNQATTITGGRYFYKPDLATTNGVLSLVVNGANNHTNSLSNYINADYDFNKRYFLNVAVSMDGSSRFGSNPSGGVSLFGHGWGIFPSVNSSWLLSSEKFMKSVNAVSLCKFRVGYGVTGNDGIRDYDASAYFTPVRYMSSANGMVMGNLANTKLQWETTGKMNAGIDLGLLKDRVLLTFDYYNAKTSNLLTLKNATEFTGINQYWSNGGEMQNRGFEASLNAKLLNLKSLKWELGLSVGHYKNQITKLPNGNYTTNVYNGEVLTAVGQPVGVFYGYKTAGVFSTEAQAASAGKNGYLTNDASAKFTAGDVHFVDTNNDGVINEKDKQVIGNPNPDVYGAIFSKLNYRRFTLNATFTYSLGNDVYNYYRSQLESGADYSNQTTTMLNRWTAEGEITNQPKAYYGDPMGNSRFSDRWIEDGSYIKLKNITLSYDLPLKISFLQGLNVWVSASNLVTWTKYLGRDPEVSAGNSVYYQGVDAGLLPQTRSYNIGFRFSL